MREALIVLAIVLLMSLIIVFGCAKPAESPEFKWPEPPPQAKVVEGPIDTFRDAKKLVNDAQQILDAAKRDGEITVKVQLPKTDPAACPSGRCAQLPASSLPTPVVAPEVPQPEVRRESCPNGNCRTRLFRRWR